MESLELISIRLKILRKHCVTFAGEKMHKNANTNWSLWWVSRSVALRLNLRLSTNEKKKSFSAEMITKNKREIRQVKMRSLFCYFSACQSVHFESNGFNGLFNALRSFAIACAHIQNRIRTDSNLFFARLCHPFSRLATLCFSNDRQINVSHCSIHSRGRK